MEKQPEDPINDEWANQILLLFLIFIFGFFLCVIGWHINHNLDTIIGQNAQIISKMK